MKALTTAALTLTVAVTTWTQSVQAQQAAAKPGPVEAFFCNYVPGKGMNDLVKVAERFAKWAGKGHPDYSAWLLTPQFGQFGELPEVVWLGSTQSGDQLGKGMDAWGAGGADIQEAFDSVVACGAHSVASSVEINAPDGPPGDGVVMFTQCNIADGSDWTKAAAAHKSYSAALRGMGAKNSNWMFFPMLGGEADRDFDYWGVSTFSSWTDFFAAYELYVNGGGWQKAAQTMAGAASCNEGSPTVWGVKQVVQGAR